MKSYQSRRRKRGAQEGNQNAEGVEKYIEKAQGNVEIVVETGVRSGLEAEITMIRRAMRVLNHELTLAETPGEITKIVQIMSLAGERLARMLQVENKLSGGISELEKDMKRALGDVCQELTEGGDMCIK